MGDVLFVERNLVQLGTLVLALGALDEGNLDDGDRTGTLGMPPEPCRKLAATRAVTLYRTRSTGTSTCTSKGTSTTGTEPGRSCWPALGPWRRRGRSCSSGTCRTSTGPRRRGRGEPPRPGRCSRAWFVSVRFTVNLDGDLDDAKLGDLDGDRTGTLGTSCSSGPWFLARFVLVRFTNLDARGPNRDGAHELGSFRFGSPRTSTTGTSTTQSSGTCRTTKAGTVVPGLVRFGSVHEPRRARARGRGRSCWPSTTGPRRGPRAARGRVERRRDLDDGDASNHQGRDGAHELGSFRFGSPRTSTGTSTTQSSGTCRTTKAGTVVPGQVRFGSVRRGPNRARARGRGRSCWPSTTGPRRRGRVEPPRPGRCSRAWFVSVRFTANLDGDLDDAKLGDVSNHQGRDGRSWPGSFWFGSTGTEPGTSSGTGTLVLALDDGTSTTGTRRTTKAGTVLTSLVRFGSVHREPRRGPNRARARGPRREPRRRKARGPRAVRG
jgi:hypothetical protein